MVDWRGAGLSARISPGGRLELSAQKSNSTRPLVSVIIETQGGELIRLGMIGCGQVTETRHLPALMRVKDIQVVAGADIDETRLSRVTNRFKIPRRYTDYHDLLKDAQVDAVAVCVPTEFHAEIGLAALAAKKYVFIEKPLALTVSDCDKMIELANRLSRHVTVGFNLRMHRLVVQARSMIASGMLGKLSLVRASLTSEWKDADLRTWRKKRESGGGVLIESAIHHFDLIRFLMQSEIDHVFAETRLNELADETAAMTAELENGVLVSWAFSKRMVSDNLFEFYGTGGRLSLSLYRFDSLEFLPMGVYTGSVGYRIKRMTHALRELPQAVPILVRGGDFTDSYRAEWQQFADSIERGAPVGSTMEDGRRALQVSLAAVHSACIGRPVRIQDSPNTVTLGREDQ